MKGEDYVQPAERLGPVEKWAGVSVLKLVLLANAILLGYCLAHLEWAWTASRPAPADFKVERSCGL